MRPSRVRLVDLIVGAGGAQRVEGHAAVAPALFSSFLAGS
jgi:hypothetical protein